MNVAVRPLAAADHDRLVAFLVGNTWPFHLFPRPEEGRVRASIEEGNYRHAHWILVDGEVAGLVNPQEVEDFTPIFDLRVAEAWRGRGLGKRALAWLAAYAFETLGKTRIEGNTRVDNVAMRRVFESCGWVQEAHYRRAWPDASGVAHDAVAYALLREDWRNGTTTPVPWGAT